MGMVRLDSRHSSLSNNFSLRNFSSPLLLVFLDIGIRPLRGDLRLLTNFPPSLSATFTRHVPTFLPFARYTQLFRLYILGTPSAPFFDCYSFPETRPPHPSRETLYSFPLMTMVWLKGRRDREVEPSDRILSRLGGCLKLIDMMD